jgi:hypothetical protein
MSQKSHHTVARKMILASHRQNATHIIFTAVLFFVYATTSRVLIRLPMKRTGVVRARLLRPRHTGMSQDAACKEVVTQGLMFVKQVTLTLNPWFLCTILAVCVPYYNRTS